MANCETTWRSSYRAVLALVQELQRTPRFEADDLLSGGDEASVQEACWDVFFARISGVQEYGFHAGLEELMWATDRLNGALTSFDWPALKAELAGKSSAWTDLIINHAKDEGVFFPDSSPREE